MFYSQTISPESKMRSPDRVFKLEIIDGKKPTSSLGVVDPRLFKEGEGGNRLHCIMDVQTSLWSLKYEKGAIPTALQGMFTGFKMAKEHAEKYFATRNIRISEVFD